ncbi:MAG: tRNA-specific adenosine deaminase [Firmicutes bacterium HGW-Firmicutes-1]|jgi:tRNA(adenine34) deaminase|nr:MAG: tRNA-specific adenosine deaminase [Firmicutes bacterium HGW-Firmicutes-1]
MQEALYEAQKAYELKEVPIGAIVVNQGVIIGRGYNRRNTDKDPFAHGEMMAIKEASLAIGDWRLEECTLYVTLEPCPMCAGAIVQSRIPKVVIGAPNFKSGSAGTIINILNVERFNHQVDTIYGVLEDECGELIKGFFKSLRKIEI